MDTKEMFWPGWETVKLIGRGSFGAVYEIQRDVFGDIEKAALKVISIPQNASDIDEMYSDGYDDESITSTFQNHLKSIVAEYSLMKKMSDCTHIVHCDDIRYVQHEDGFGWDTFIKMELLTPLNKALPAEISEEMVVKVAKELCEALIVCKEHNVVHRDIKPQNVFMSRSGVYKLGDFGIAKTVEKTMGGTKIGTYKFMAPEVYNNQPYGQAADVYSLGLVLYWLLNERRMPFMPLPPEKLSAGMEEKARARRFSGEPLPAPAHGSDELKRIVLKACAFDPKDRYQSAQEMREDLMHLSGGYAPELQTEVGPAVDPSLEEETTGGPLFANKSVSEAMEEITVGPVFAPRVKPEYEKENDVSKKLTHDEKKKTGIALPNGFWKCVCGRTNASYVSSCACHINKRELRFVTEKNNQSDFSSLPDGFWKCSCGRSNAFYVSSCACGVNKRDISGRN